MRFTREEFRARLDHQMRDEAFVERVTAASNGEPSPSGAVVSVAALALESDPERFLERFYALSGPLPPAVSAEIISAFRHHEPIASIVARAARHLERAKPGVRVEGHWIPSSVADLATCPAQEFAERLYRSFIWRDPTVVERATVEGRLAAGETRIDVILSVASLPFAIASSHAVEGVVNVTSLLDANGDAEFVKLLYRDVCERTAGDDEVHGWVGVLRDGMSRVEVLRRFINLTVPNGAFQIFVGLPDDAAPRRGPA